MLMVERRQSMNNYLNNTTFAKESSKSWSRYLSCEEKHQRQWINQVAKQAAKLISEQIKESGNQSKESK